MSNETNKEEERYFLQIQQERREQQRRERELAALRAQEREGIARALNTTEAVAEEALELGFDADTARLLPLIPLIQVAWADGSVSTAEERAVLELAHERGLEPATPAYNFLTRLLQEQPSALFFERATAVILEIVSLDRSSWMSRSLPDLCKAVAQASGGFFGLGNKVSDEEQALIDDLAQRLNLHNSSASAVLAPGSDK